MKDKCKNNACKQKCLWKKKTEDWFELWTLPRTFGGVDTKPQKTELAGIYGTHDRRENSKNMTRRLTTSKVKGKTMK